MSTRLRPSAPALLSNSARAGGKAGLTTIGLAAALLLAGCGLFDPKPQTRGHLVDADVLKELVPGTSTRADASALLGSPTAKASFDDNTWIYIGETTERQVAST